MEDVANKICPTCEGEVKFDIIDGKCKACRLGVVPDWAKTGKEPLWCEDCGEDPKGRRSRCPRCKLLVCGWCMNHVHDSPHKPVLHKVSDRAVES